MHSDFCLQHYFDANLVRPLVISSISLDGIFTSSHRIVVLGLLCLLAFLSTGAFSVCVYLVSILLDA